LVNCLRDNPMTQFSIQWILSLNRLCQKWGQVQVAPKSRRPQIEKNGQERSIKRRAAQPFADHTPTVGAPR